jgi:predicted porin
MKKSVLALAALGAFAGSAMAQSSVTMFGVVDLNVRYVNNDDTTYSLSQDGMASSRLGFRGVEDLGGGLKASFWLEAAIGPDTGRGSSSFGNGTTTTSVNCAGLPGCPASGTASISNENSFLFQRRSTVSLSNQWGELRLGRDYTPQFWNWTVFDPFGTNGIGAATNLAIAVNNIAGSGGSYGTLVRANNSVQYILPNGVFGPGLYGQVMVAAGENAVGNKMWGGRIGYSAGPFNVAAAYSDTDVTDNISATNWNIAGSWDFKTFGKISAFYSQIEVEAPGIIAGKGGQDNWYIGYAIPFGQANFKISWGQADGSGVTSDRGAKQWAIGADYNLSKRTAVYATASAVNNDAGNSFRVAPTSPLSPGENSTGFEVGVRHSF